MNIMLPHALLFDMNKFHNMALKKFADVFTLKINYISVLLVLSSLHALGITSTSTSAHTVVKIRAKLVKISVTMALSLVSTTSMCLHMVHCD
jgi:hypothetical protein